MITIDYNCITQKDTQPSQTCSECYTSVAISQSFVSLYLGSANWTRLDGSSEVGSLWSSEDGRCEMRKTTVLYFCRALHGIVLQNCAVEKRSKTTFTQFVHFFLARWFVQNLHSQSNFLRTHYFYQTESLNSVKGSIYFHLVEIDFLLVL
jgi:hypothetical protein